MLSSHVPQGLVHTPRCLEMPIGTVKWFDAKKGFGFLLDAEGQDIFVHYTTIEGEGYRRLWDGEQVEFECTRGPKGLLASRCRRLSTPSGPGGKPDGQGDDQPPTK
jgi:CspA family cold shock protein